MKTYLPQRSRRTGFTLIEILISLGIFVVGMVAVASLFPVSALLQKETANDIRSQQAAASARATLEGIGLTYAAGNTATDLGMYHPSASDTKIAVEFVADLSSTTFFDNFSDSERSFPLLEADVNERDFYWFFFVRDTSGSGAAPTWQGYVLIVERLDGQSFNDVAAGIKRFSDNEVPTENGTPYITLDGKTGNWSVISPPTVFGNAVYFHPQGVAVETFSFETTAP